MTVATPRGTPHATRLFAGASLALHDWRCAGHDAPVARDEHTPAFDVVVVRRGAFELDVAGRRQLLVAGQVWFARPGEPYRIRHPVPGGDHCTIVRLPPATEQRLLEHAGTDPDELATRSGACVAPLDGRQALLHQLAWREASRAAHGGADALAIEEHATRFLARVAPALGRGRRLAAPPRPSRLAQRAMEHVLHHYRTPLTVEAIAVDVGASPFHLSRVVSRATGRSIHQHVVRLRLRDALERVLDTRDGLSAIAHDVGFSSHSHFTEAFRREFGATPAALRRGRAAM